MNQEAILAVLPDSKDDAKSLKEIAKEMGLEITAHVDWIRVERPLKSCSETSSAVDKLKEEYEHIKIQDFLSLCNQAT